MNAFIVAVNYTDELKLTLPYNRHHFRHVVIVTDMKCQDEVIKVAIAEDAMVIGTDAFYANGASFNKWLPLDLAVGQNLWNMHDWVCIMDADVIWPKVAPLDFVKGVLYTPYRRMYPSIPAVVPPENTWLDYERHRNIGEFAGYSQVFHSDDQALARCAECGHGYEHHAVACHYGKGCSCKRFSLWQTDWVHAGGADSFFQRRWQPHNKVRPPWECLHLGPAGQNWYGRSSPLADGTLLPGSEERKKAYLDIWPSRRREKDPEFKSERTARAD